MKVLVTGASSGIGREAAAEFARHGHTVFAAARRAEALGELAADAVGIIPMPMNVTDPDSVGRAWAQIEQLTDHHGVDVLVNAAGYALTGPVETLSDGEITGQFDANRSGDGGAGRRGGETSEALRR